MINQKKKEERKQRLSDKTETEQANILLNQELNGDDQSLTPKETMASFINRNQS